MRMKPTWMLQPHRIYLLRLSFLHPKHPKPRLLHWRVERRRISERQHAARFARRDDAVVPQPRGGKVWIALFVERILDRLLELGLLDLAPLAAARLDVVAAHGREHGGRLLRAHQRDARVRPGEQEARAIGAPAHAVIAGAV